MTATTTEKREVCSITVIFPVSNDDEAIAVKKVVAESVKTIEDARIDFRISSIPMPGQPPNR